MDPGYEPAPAAPPSRSRPRAVGWSFVLVVLVLNLMIVGAAWLDSSWGVLAIAFVFGPAANAILAIAGTIGFALLRKWTHPSLLADMSMTLLLPLLAMIVDVFVILSMDLRGC